MLLKDMILTILHEGAPVTAASVARRCGEDRVRCHDVLKQMKSKGFCRSRAFRANGNKFGDERFVPCKESLEKLLVATPGVAR